MRLLINLQGTEPDHSAHSFGGPRCTSMMSIVTHLLLEVVKGAEILEIYTVLRSAINLSVWCGQELPYRIIAAVNFIKIFPTIHCNIHA
jgi:hypothetical protein